MKLIFGSIGRRRADGDFEKLARLYLDRLLSYVEMEVQVYRSEDVFWGAIDRQRSRLAPVLVLLDSRGKMLTSEALAEWLGRERDSGAQTLIFAVGPPDGWSEAALARVREEQRAGTGLLLSLGLMTLPHELARVVLAEQVYRAFTILARHPYHSGH